MTATHISYNAILNKVQVSMPKCIKSKNANIFQDLFDTKLSAEAKCFIEAAVRQYVIGILNVPGPIQLEEIKFIVKMCLEGAQHENCLPNLPIIILSDAFDCITIEQCKELFEFVESNVSTLKEPQFFSICKNQVLRMCNDVLRRLSRTQNTIFCGRILLFLARFFPFAERSGLNLISEFNLENITLLTNAESDSSEEKVTDIKDEESFIRPSQDYTLYTKFWALQDFFRNPIQCFQNDPWKMFIQNCDDVLEAFKSFKLDTVQGSETEKSNSNARDFAPVDHSDSLADDYFPKYLSSQKLLDLQFSDSNFRRYILVQMLILGQYLTSNIKFKQEYLNPDQISWVKAMQEKAYSLIIETPPNGREFANVVRFTLRREFIWNDWKNNGCPEIKRPAPSLKRKLQDSKQNEKEDKLSSEAVVEPLKKRERRKLGDIIRDGEANNKFIMGNAELSRLWNICPDNFEACQKECRNFVPSLETYFSDAIEQIHSKTTISESDKLVNNSNFCWRALRLLGSKSPHFFTNAGSNITSLSNYLTSTIKKDFPDQLNKKLKEGDANEEDPVEEVNNGGEPTTKDDEEMTPEEVDEEDSEMRNSETKPVDESERKLLAKALAEEPDTYKKLGRKLGFDDDELDWFMSSKALVDGIEIMLERWVENEEDEANKDMLIYIMEGLKLHSIIKKVYG